MDQKQDKVMCLKMHWGLDIADTVEVQDGTVPFVLPVPNLKMGTGFVWNVNLQVKGLVEFGRPTVVLGLGLEFAFLVAEVRSDHGDLHKWPEHPGRLPLQIISSHNCSDT